MNFIATFSGRFPYTCHSLITFALLCRLTQTQNIDFRQAFLYSSRVSFCASPSSNILDSSALILHFLFQDENKSAFFFRSSVKRCCKSSNKHLWCETKSDTFKRLLLNIPALPQVLQRAFIKPCRHGVVFSEREKNRLKINEEDDERWKNITMTPI